MLGSEVTVVEAMDSVLPILTKNYEGLSKLPLKSKKSKTHLGVFAKGVEETKDGS
jgi:pyruvate/2-oxoglutarate dehydrogenase complex dihydrolipoamide dehydrogenase (E3) component